MRVVPAKVVDFVASMPRSEEHTSELQSRGQLVCRLLLEKKNRRRAACPIAGAGPYSPTSICPQSSAYSDYSGGEIRPPPIPVCSRECVPERFFFNDAAPTEIYTLSLHDALPIFDPATFDLLLWAADYYHHPVGEVMAAALDRKSTRLNSSHVATSYAVFCLKKKTPSPSDPTRMPLGPTDGFFFG